jgi:hypothetical protein
MAEKLVAGWHQAYFNLEPTSNHRGVIRICAWNAPLFGAYDAGLDLRPKLMPVRSIMVEREISTNHISPPYVKWDDGTDLSNWARRRLPEKIQRRIKDAIEETRRVAGRKR